MSAKTPACKYCAYREERFLCGATSSTYHGQTVLPDNACDVYQESPGLVAYSSALITGALDSTNLDEEIAAWETALSHDLPKDCRAEAALFCGLAHLASAFKSGSADAFTESEEGKRGVLLIEEAAALDREGNFGVLQDRAQRPLLRQADVAYGMLSFAPEESSGSDEAIRFIESRLALFEYLPSTPFLALHNRLGYLYATQKGDRAAAARCWQTVLAADVVVPNKDDEFKQEARRNLAVAAKADSSSSEPTAGSSESTCFIAGAVYGDMAPEVKVLRSFRDRRLRRFSLGRGLISLYERLSPALADRLRSNPRLRRVVRYPLGLVVRLLR